MTNSPDKPTPPNFKRTITQRHQRVMTDLSAMQNSPDIPDYYRKTVLPQIHSLLKTYEELLNVPLFPSSERLTTEQVERNKGLHRLVTELRFAQTFADESTWQLLERAVNRLISLQLANTAMLNASADKQKRTSWTNGPDDSPEEEMLRHNAAVRAASVEPVPPMTPDEQATFNRLHEDHPTIDDVEPKGRLIAPTLGVEAEVEEIRSFPYPSDGQMPLPTPQDYLLAKASDAVDPEDRKKYEEEVLNEWKSAPGRIQLLPEPDKLSGFTDQQKLRMLEDLGRPNRRLTAEELADEMSLGSAPLQTAAIIHAAAGDYQKAQFSMLRALFMQQAESEERLSKRLDRPKFNTRRSTERKSQ